MSLTWAPCRVREPGGSSGAGRHHFRRRTFAPCPSPTPAAERGGPGAWNVTVNVRASGPIMPYRPGNGPGQRRSLKGWGGKKPPATLPGKEGQEPHMSLLRHYVFCSRTSFFKNWFLPSSPITTPPSSLLPPALPPFPQILERLPQARRFLSVDPPPPRGGGGPGKGTTGKPFREAHSPTVLCPHWPCLPGSTCLSEQGPWGPVRVTCRNGHLQGWDRLRPGGLATSALGENRSRRS